MKKITFAALAASLFFALLASCTTTELDQFLTGDIYRMVSKEKHEREYPHGHLNDLGEVPGNRCFYDKIRHKYFCQHPFSDDKGEK